MKKGLISRLVLGVTFTFLFISFGFASDVSVSNRIISPGFYLVELGMGYLDVSNTLGRNQFLMKGRPGYQERYVRKGPFPKYPYIKELTYIFNFSGREDQRDSWNLWRTFTKRDGNKFWFDPAYRENGLSFVPSHYLPPDPSNECKFPAQIYQGKRCNFYIHRDAKLINFFVKMSITDEYKKGIADAFLDKFSQKYGPPNAKGFFRSGARGYSELDAAWFDDKTFMGYTSSEWGRQLVIFYSVVDEAELKDKLLVLEKEAVRFKQECMNAKNKEFNKIKVD